MTSRNEKKNRKQRRSRRRFTPEFKTDVVKLCQSGAESVTAVSRRLDLTPSAVREWVLRAEAVAAAGPGSTLTASEQQELRELRKQVKLLKMEREILKKAATFFAKENS